MRLFTSKNRAIQKYLETLSEYSILVQVEARSTKRTAVLSNKVKRSCRVVEKAICMKTKDQLYQRESVILRPRVVLKAKFAMWFTRSETRSNTTDYRIFGISISTVKLQDARRQNKVTKLIEMSENISIWNNALRHESKVGDQQVQRGSTTITRRHEPNRDLRTLREFCKTSMSWLQCFLRNRDHLLQLR